MDQCHKFPREHNISGIPVSRTFDFSNFLISRTNFHFSWIYFPVILPPSVFLEPPDFPNQFLFALEFRETGIVLSMYRSTILYSVSMCA